MKGCVLGRARKSENCHVGKVATALHTDCERAYAMILMTATLTDLSPYDPAVADVVLRDVGVEDPDCVAAC